MLKITPYTLGIYCEIFDEKVKAFKEFFCKEYLGQNFPPHISLLSMPLPEVNIELAHEKANLTLPRIHNLNVKIADLSIDSATNFALIKLSGDEVITVHNDLREEFNNLRDGYIREKDEKIAENEFVRKYGFKYSGENYVLHLSLGKIVDNVGANLSKLFDEFNKIKGMEINLNSINAGVILDRDSEKKSIWEEKYTLLQN